MSNRRIKIVLVVLFVIAIIASMYTLLGLRPALKFDSIDEINLPPDEINLVEEGKDYGWPICFGKNIHDTDFDKNVYVQNPCMEPLKMPSLIDIQAHSAPLGLAFYYGDNFPQEYRGDLFVALHGSWNRREPTGYKIISIDMNDLTVRDFATGWLQDSNVLGRPVDIIVAEDGSLFVSDDNAGKIYRISYQDKDGPVGI